MNTAPQPLATEPADPFRGLLRHAGWNLASVLVPGVYGLSLAWFLLRSLGATGYAPWAAGVALAGWLTLLDLGLSSTTTREAARAASGDADAAERVRAASAVYAGVGVAAVLAGSTVALFLGPLLGLAGSAATEAWLVGSLLALDLAVVLGTSGWTGAIRGHRRFDVLFFANGVQVAVAVVALVILFPPLGLPGAAVAQVVGRIAGRIITAAWLSRNVRWLPIRPGRPRLGAIRQLTRFAGPVVAMHAAGQIGIGTDVVVVATVAGAAGVGAFAAGSQLARYLGVLVLPVLSSALPVFSEAAYARPAEIPAMLLRATFLGALVGGTLFGGLALNAGLIVPIWTGGPALLTEQVLVVYSLVYVLVTPTHVAIMMLVARGLHAPIGLVGITEGLVNLGLSFVLAGVIGPVGVAASTLGVATVNNLITTPLIASIRLAVPYRLLIGSAAIGWLVAAAMLAVSLAIPAVGPLALVARAAVVGLLFLAVLRLLWTWTPFLNSAAGRSGAGDTTRT